VDFRGTHSQEWLDYFAQIGYPAAQPLAAGVEGAVYRLGDGIVAKVWHRRGAPELRLWQAFHADVAASGLPSATPVILRVDEVEGRSVTLERELPGSPLLTRSSTSRARRAGRAAVALRRDPNPGC
jgi:hypothetical protein